MKLVSTVAQPEVSVTQIEKGKDFIFDATVTVEPEVKLGDYKGLEIENKILNLQMMNCKNQLIIV